MTNPLNPIIDPGMESIFTTGSSTITPIPSPKSIMTPSIITTTTIASQPPIPPTPIPSDVLQTLLTFASVFRFEDRVKSLEVNFSELMRTNQSTEAVSNIPGLVHQYMHQEMTLKKILIEKMEGNKSIQRSDEQQNLYKALVEAYDADKTILDSYRESTILKRRREDDDDQEGPSAGSDRGSKRRREGGEHASASTPSEPATGSVGRSTTGTQSRQMSASESALAEEPVQTTCQMEEPLHPVFETGAEDQPIFQTSQHPEWFFQPRKPPTPNRDWNKSLPAAQGNAQSWISALAKQTDANSSFNELLDTPIDFSNFIMNRLGVDTLTPELLAGPTYELIRGLCNSLTKLEYHLEEPLSFEHFINNDLEFLRGCASSRKYTTSVTKTKAADYGHIKWIEDLVPRTMWIQEPINYDKHALWGVSHWGRKRQHFYEFAVNRESALDVYSKRRIIAVTDLKIVEWHNYKHLDWISVRRDDDKIYKFKEGDFKSLRLQDIEDMLLLLVQEKLSNLTVEERFAFNVSLRMFTRSIVIQRHVEDLQLGVKSYQKRLNLTKPDTKGDKDRAAAMIQAIDKMLKTRRTMRSLERFPLSLIPDNRGRRVIPFVHFINNDLEYLRGGASSRKYTTSVTKMKAADYGHIKWIEDLVPRTMWIQEPIDYDKHALWGVSHWGSKRHQFYGFAVNRESARDVYSKRRIIAVTKLKIVEWHSYKHLDWITVRRDDDKLYKFKAGDFKRRIQDIEDMLLLLIQGKLTNLTVEERFSFNVSFRMFTRSIVI
nr:hypothetical protein [Tanacetum cinerariifolium]